MNLIDWLLAGDVAIQFQVHRDLLDTDRPDLQARIATEGWGAQLLALRRPNGDWGREYYFPKWTNTHYTLCELRRLELPHNQPEVQESLRLALERHPAAGGGIAPWGSDDSDTCVDGMFLHIAAWFRVPEDRLHSMVDSVLDDRMPDGGFNCRKRRSGAHHSSMHTTVSVLEGIQSWLDAGYAYRSDELAKAAVAARAFLLLHRLFKSDRTGKIIHPSFLKLSYPPRWRYDILRALDHFRAAGHDDPRLADALEVLEGKRRKDGRWPVQAKHPGQTHFDMEKAGGPSRWNTLRALRVQRCFTTPTPSAPPPP